jgi:hypothetical protein
VGEVRNARVERARKEIEIKGGDRGVEEEERN